MKTLRLLTLAFIASLALISSPLAQSNFVTPGGANVPGAVDMCLNGSNQAVPCSVTNPLAVNATVSASVTFPTFGAAFPATGIAMGFSQGGNLVGATGTAGNLNVNCQVGCAGGSTSNAGSGVATSATNGATVAYLYGWNGATWDQIETGDVNNDPNVTGDLNVLPVARYNATQPTLTDTRYNMLQVAARGGLYVATGSDAFNVQNITGTVSLPTGAATQATLASILTAVQSPLPTQAATIDIGAVGISQTTPGTTNKVAVGALPRAARNTPGCTVGTSSGTCLAATTAVTFLQIQNTSTANTVACNIVGGTAVLNSATSVQLAVGQAASWGPNTGGVPSGAINCIASGASTPLYVEWN